MKHSISPFRLVRRPFPRDGADEVLTEDIVIVLHLFNEQDREMEKFASI